MRLIRVVALMLTFSLFGSTAHSNTPLPSQFNSEGALAFRPDGTPLAGFNADGSSNTNLPTPTAPPGFIPPAGFVPPPGYVPPLPSQFNSEGALAFRPDGTPLAGFNADGSSNTNLPKPIAPPGFLAPLPPPLFNPDGSPFVVGSKLEMPVRADGSKLEYDFDPISGWYIPAATNSTPLPSQFNSEGALAFKPDGSPLPGFNPDGSVNTNLPKPIAPANPVIYNPDGTLFTPNTPGPLPPPLFNSDGTKFVVGSKIQTPVRADGTQISYEYDVGTGLYWPTPSETRPPVVIPAPGVSAITFIYDDVAKQMIPVTYRSTQIPAVNFDGSVNDASKVVIPDITADTAFTSIPKSAQIGSWAVVAKNGTVINSILCSENICGPDGDWGGKVVDPNNCPNGCQLVLQIPANPITGQSMGGYLTSGDTKVTYKNGEFKVASPASSSTAKNLVRTIKNGVLTDITGERIDLSTGIQLPSNIKDAQLKKRVDTAITQVDIEPIKSDSGYQLTTNQQLPAIDASLRITAIRAGAKTQAFKVNVDKSGEIFLPTKMDLTGYVLQIKRGSKVLKKVLID